MFASDYKKKIGDLIWFGYVISFQRIHSFPYGNTSINFLLQVEKT